MPNLVKVGYTSGPVDVRLTKLNSTGVPTPFTLCAQFYVSDPKTTEKDIHKLLQANRVNMQREFFSGSASKIIEICLPLLLEAIPDSAEITENFFDDSLEEISETQRYLLESLVVHRNQGISLYEFEDDKSLDKNSLFVEKELEELKTNGYVEVLKARKTYEGDKWRVTSKGIKMLFDIGVLVDGELEKYSWPYA